MFDAIVDLLPKVDAAISESAGVIPRTDLERMTRLRNRVESRVAHPADVVLAALAGGTGSGKSSLFNAIAKAEIADTGGIRPTTSTPLAVTAVGRSAQIERYLGRLGIAIEESANLPAQLCLIDLPDTDSVEIEHRHTVDHLLPLVDVVVWVVDPEKYADAALHQFLLRPMLDYRDQFLFVLNQIDRVEEHQRSRLKDDFTRVLRDTGVSSPTVMATSANPPVGPPLGVERLVMLLDPAGGEINTAGDKLLIDLHFLARDLVEATGGGRGLDFEDRWQKARAGASLAIATGNPAAAGHELAELLESLGREMGDPLGVAIRAQAVEAASLAEDTSVAALTHGQPHARGLRPARGKDPSSSGEASREALEMIESSLEAAVGAPLRERLSRRARANAAITDLYLSVGRLTAVADS